MSNLLLYIDGNIVKKCINYFPAREITISNSVVSLVMLGDFESWFIEAHMVQESSLPYRKHKSQEMLWLKECPCACSSWYMKIWDCFLWVNSIYLHITIDTKYIISFISDLSLNDVAEYWATSLLFYLSILQFKLVFAVSNKMTRATY